MYGDDVVSSVRIRMVIGMREGGINQWDSVGGLSYKYHNVARTDLLLLKLLIKVSVEDMSRRCI